MNTIGKTRFAFFAGPVGLASLLAVAACSGKISSDDTAGLGAAPGKGGMSGAGVGGSVSTGLGGSSNVGTGGMAAQGGGPLIDPNMGASGESAHDDGGAAGSENECATVSAAAKLEPVYLAFAFDVSGSMGNLGQPWYDPALKWEPAVEATRAFLEDDTAKGLFASMTTFPIKSDDEGARCNSSSYATPDVAMTELPSTDFGARLDAIRASYWGEGTPTLAVVNGVIGFVSQYREDHPGNYAIVLVTDGYPQGCDGNSIETVQTAVRGAADDVPTYVIGVKNPPITDNEGNMAPDTVTNLNGIATAGGTEEAFMIDTGDPEQTQADFREAIEAIRGAAIACSLEVPTPPDKRKFQKDHVAVSMTEGDKTTDLEYDEACGSDKAWHYDSTSDPTEVVLCPSTCTRLQDAAEAKLHVAFTCEQVIMVR